MAARYAEQLLPHHDHLACSHVWDRMLTSARIDMYIDLGNVSNTLAKKMLFPKPRDLGWLPLRTWSRAIEPKNHRSQLAIKSPEPSSHKIKDTSDRTSSYMLAKLTLEQSNTPSSALSNVWVSIPQTDTYPYPIGMSYHAYRCMHQLDNNVVQLDHVMPSTISYNVIYHTI